MYRAGIYSKFRMQNVQSSDRLLSVARCLTLLSCIRVFPEYTGQRLLVARGATLLSCTLAANDFARLALSATTILSLWFGRPFGAIYRKISSPTGSRPRLQSRRCAFGVQPPPRGLHKQDSEEQLMHRLYSIETVCSLYRTEVKSFAFPVAACISTL